MNLPRKLLALPAADRSVLLVAVALLALVGVALCTLPFALVWRWANRLARTTPAAPACPPERIAWAVNAAARRVPGHHRCLARAVTAYILLRRHGYAARMRLGVARVQSRLEAHAWVERNGAVLVGGPDVSRFAPLPPLERAIP